MNICLSFADFCWLFQFCKTAFQEKLLLEFNSCFRIKISSILSSSRPVGARNTLLTEELINKKVLEESNQGGGGGGGQQGVEQGQQGWCMQPTSYLEK